MHTPCNSNVPQFDEGLRVVKLERINGGTFIYMKLLMKTRTQKKYESYIGLKPFKCPPSPRVLLRQNYSVVTKNNQLHPLFVTGFSDGEGCFDIEVRQSDKYKAGFGVQCCFLFALKGPSIIGRNTIILRRCR
jgi:hypothetical protein